MQLVLIPVLLVAGITLIVLSANGVPSLSALVQSEERSHPRPRPRPMPGKLPQARSATRGRAASFERSDPLLADLMQEMIGLGQQLTELKREVDDLTTENRRRAASGSRRRKPQDTAA